MRILGKHPPLSDERQEGPDWRLIVLLVAGVLLVGISLGGVLSRLLRPGRGPQGLAEASLTKPRLPLPAAQPPEEPAEPAPRHRQPEAKLTAEKFLARLLRETPRPVAARVARAFAREPALRNAWADFKKTHGRNAPATEFIRAVAPVPEFRALVAELKDQPDFRRALEDLARQPGSAAMLRPPAAGGPASASGNPPGTFAFAAGPIPGTESGPAAPGSRGGSRPKAGAVQYPAAERVEDKGQDTGNRRGQFLTEKAGRPEEKEGSKGRSGPSGSTGEDGHSVGALDKWDRGDVANTSFEYFASMIAVMDKGTRSRMEQACREDESGLMCDAGTACAGEFLEACQDACRKSPATCAKLDPDVYTMLMHSTQSPD